MSETTIGTILVLGAFIAAIVGFAWFMRRPKNWATEPPPVTDPGLPIITRTYHGNAVSAAAAFGADANVLAGFGYAPVNQAYQPGSWGLSGFSVAVLLILAFGIGLLVLLYMLVVKPPGTLVVTYQRQAPASPARQVFPVAGAG